MNNRVEGGFAYEEAKSHRFFILFHFFVSKPFPFIQASNRSFQVDKIGSRGAIVPVAELETILGVCPVRFSGPSNGNARNGSSLFE